MKSQTTSPEISGQERRIHDKYGFFLLICTFILLVGCDQTFEPLQENDKYYFSIYGTLDAAVDTQWVRIGPARQDINELPGPGRIQVTLKDLQTEKTVVLNDSLFASGDLLNYWTTMPLENEHTYQIQAERDDGKMSVVTVTMPRELPTPFVTQNTFPPLGYNIYIDGSVEYVTDLQSKWYVLLYPQTERIKKFIRLPTGIKLFTFQHMAAPGSHSHQLLKNSGLSKTIQNAEFAVYTDNFL